MPKLTDSAVRAAKPKDKSFKISDGKNLYLWVTTTGGKSFRLDYRFEGKGRTLVIGTYPEISLAEARDKRDAARKLLAAGVDPNEAKKAAARVESNANTFEAMGREWFDTNKKIKNWAFSHSSKIIARLERDVFPWIGKRPISEVERVEILNTVICIQKRGKIETAHRALSEINQIFNYALDHCKGLSNPTIGLHKSLAPIKRKHFKAITDSKGVGQLLRDIDEYQKCSFITHCGIKLAPYVFVRPGELCEMQWKDIDWEEKQWKYFITKTETDHIVPLSRQAIEILKEIQHVAGERQFVFTNARSKEDHATVEGLGKTLIGMGYKGRHTTHGWRATARTMLAQEEGLEFKFEIIELQLAHAVNDALGVAYNRTDFLPQRTKMMQIWADFLDKLRSNVV